MQKKKILTSTIPNSKDMLFTFRTKFILINKLLLSNISVATAVTSTIVIIFKYTSPCKCSDSLLCQNNFNDQIWPIHKCVRRQFSVTQ